LIRAFPANRENNSELSRKRADAAMAGAKLRSIFMGLTANSRRRANREFRFGEQGIAACGIGNSREFVDGGAADARGMADERPLVCGEGSFVTA
jgi:hypothetical protein